MLGQVSRNPLVRSLAVPVALSWVVAALVLVSSVAGLLFGGQSLYDQDKLVAFVGQDAISLVVALPLLVGSLVLARRGSVRALLVWMGSLFYVLYGYCYYVFGARFNLLFLVYVALVSLSLYALLWLLMSADAEEIRGDLQGSLSVRPIAGFLVGVAIVFALFWSVPIIAAGVGGQTLDAVPRLVSTLDFVFMLPSYLIGGILLWRREPWGYVVSGVILVMGTFYALTLVALSVLGVLLGGAADPYMIPFVLTGVGGLICAVPYFRAVRRFAESGSEPAARPF